MKKLDIKKLAEVESENLVSIYMPVNKSGDVDQERIKFKNLLNEAEDILEEKGADPDPVLEEGYKLYESTNFWSQMNNGLAVLLGGEEVIVIHMNRQPSQYVTVEDRYRIIPLLNDYEQLNETYILNIAKDNFSLFFGDASGIREVELEGVEQTFDELYPDKDNQYALDRQSGNVLYYKRQDISDLKDNERTKFFRHVGEALRDAIGHDTPLIIFGTTENVAAFEDVEDDLNIKALIEKPMDSMTKDETYDLLIEELRPRYIEKIEEELEVLRSAIAASNGTDNLSRIKNDQDQGRIAKLYIGSNFDGLELEETDQLVQNVIKNGGQVVYVSNDYNDFQEKIAAIYRY